MQAADFGFTWRGPLPVLRHHLWVSTSLTLVSNHLQHNFIGFSAACVFLVKSIVIIILFIYLFVYSFIYLFFLPGLIELRHTSTATGSG